MDKLIRITTVPVSLEKLLEGQLNFMQQEYEVVAISSDEERLTKLGREIGVRTYAVEMTREITPAKDLRSLWKLYRFLKKEKPLIVHTHTPKAGIAGMMAAKMAGVPLRLHTVAGLPLLEASGGKKKVLEMVEKLTFACATNVYPNSKKIHEILKARKFTTPKKLKVIGKGSSNGIDTSYFDPDKYSQESNYEFKKKIGIPEKDFVFIFVGRLVRDKGINELVLAFQNLHKKYSNTSLLLVGPYEAELDPLEDGTMKTIKDHSKIIEVGYQDDVRPFLACSEVLTFPSYREGFPNVVMQAGAMGLPAIVTNINGCNEIIREGTNGTLVPVKNAERLQLAMEKMLTDVKWRMELSKNSRKEICENFERVEMWKALLAEYKRLESEIRN